MTVDWDELVEEFGPLVYSSAWRILRHREQAEDIVQDVLTHAWLRRNEPIRNLAGWMRHLATCRALDALRRRRTVPFHDLDFLATPQDNTVEQAELMEVVRTAVANLPEQQATIFALRYFEEMSNAEIALHLDVTTSAVSSALHVARNSLANTLTPILEGK